MALRDVIPPPSCEKLKELQLMRYTLVKFVELRNFEEAIQGCYVRVLLEMRADRETTTAPTSGDSYYIAAVKGAQRGLAYSGFSWDGLSTEWHIVIDLPPCFRSGPNNNIVQFNSISNSPFSANEYRDWVQMGREAARTFPTVAQLDLRISLLRDALRDANIDVSQANATRRRRQNVEPEDAERLREREARWSKMKEDALKEINEKYRLFPALDKLKTTKVDDLNQIHRDGLDLSGKLRIAINERMRCRVCHTRPNAVVCYPCKHQALCEECSPQVTICPMCDAAVSDKFTPYSA
jgi:hypothetical protein